MFSLLRCPALHNEALLRDEITLLRNINQTISAALINTQAELYAVRSDLHAANLRNARCVSSLHEMDRLVSSIESLSTWPNLRPIFRQLIRTCEEANAPNL